MINIVLVDDDEKIAQLSGQSLASKGYQVEIFTNPLSALSFIAEHNDYKILISDNIMPELNGEDLIREAFAKRSDLLAILATGDDSYDFDLTCYEGRVVVVSKPFRRKDLIDTIESLLTKF